MNISKKVIASCLAFSMIVTLANGCPTVSAASKPKLSQTKLNLKVGESKKLKVKKSKKKVKWSSNKKKVASVNKKGLVKARKKGKAVITAKVAGKKLKCKVNVKAKTPSTSGQTGTTNAPGTSAQPGKTPTPGTSTQPGKTSTPGTSAQPSPTPTLSTSAQPSPTPTLGTSAQPSPTPTPETSGQPEPAMALKASHASGTYDSAFQLTLSSEAGASIYYTLDGSNPLTSTTKKTYSDGIYITDRKSDANVLSAVTFDKFYIQGYDEGAINPTKDVVDKCTIVRAVAVGADGSQSAIMTYTYFIGNMSQHINSIQESVKAAGKDLAVISITMDYNDLFDETKGIYVIGKDKEHPNFKQKGKEWERDCHIDYFESNGTKTSLELSQDCGIRIQGNYSREDIQKSFRLYAKEKYGTKNFKYPFFDGLNNAEGKPMQKFKTLVLRNGGNDAWNYKYKDNIMQSFMHDLECETLHGRPCVVYLDGEYWGYYVLQDDVSDNFLQEKRGVAKEQVVVYKGSDDPDYEEYGYKLDVGKLPEGVTDESHYLKDTLQFLDSHDLSKDTDYQEFIEKYVSEDSVADYFASMLYLNNRYDWPGKNWSIWRTQDDDRANRPYEDGRWRFCIYDLDLTTNTTWNAGGNLDTVDKDNVVSLARDDGGNIPKKFYANMMKNTSFRKKLADKVKKLATEVFTASKAEARGQEYYNIYSPLYNQFKKRFLAENIWQNPYSNQEDNIAWLKQRVSYVDTLVNHIQSFDKDSSSSFGDAQTSLPLKDNTLIWQGKWNRANSSVNETTAKTEGLSVLSADGSFIQLTIDESIWKSYQKPMLQLKVADGANENARCHVWSETKGDMNEYYYLKDYPWTTTAIDISGISANVLYVNANDAQLVEIRIFEGN